MKRWRFLISLPYDFYAFTMIMSSFGFLYWLVLLELFIPATLFARMLPYLGEVIAKNFSYERRSFRVR